MMAAVPQDAVDDLIELLDLEPIEVNIFRGIRPDEDRQRVFGGQVAGQALVAAARTVDRRLARALAARLLPAPRRPDGADPLRGRPHPRRPLVHHPPGRGHPARPGDLQPVGRRSTCTRTASTTRSRCPSVPPPETLPDSDRMGAVAPTARRLLRPAPGHRHPLRRLVPPRPGARRAAAPAGVAAGRRRAARRPGAARLRAHLRVGHDAARHHAAPPRRRARRRARS